MKRHFGLHDGHLIDPLNIKKSDITLERIAHQLTGIERYGGSLPLDVRYNVAEHSINLACCFNTDEEVKHALMHDAAEAFLGDIVVGLKDVLPEYKRIEKRLEKLIFDKYGINKFASVKEKDTRIVLDEAWILFRRNYNVYWENNPLREQGKIFTKPEEELYYDMSREKGKRMFLSMCKMFKIED